MNNLKLYESPVQFVEDRDKDLHEYWLGFKTLTGVTSVLKAVLYYDKYADIDPAVLRYAANRGTAIHEAVQAVEMGEPDPACPECYAQDVFDAVSAYLGGPRMAELRPLRCIASEYMVSNEEDIASKVDAVYQEDDDAVALVDYKTTSELDTEYVSWQLSVYKYFYLRQNPGQKVTRLMVFWYERPARRWYAIEVQDKGAEAVEALIEDYRQGVRRPH